MIESGHNSNNSSIAVIDYETQFKQEQSKFLLSGVWSEIETVFKRELQLHIVPGDFDNLVVYLREQKENNLATFKASGLISTLWERSFCSATNSFDEAGFLQKLYFVSDSSTQEQDIIIFFRYYCLNNLIESILQKVLEMQATKYRGNFNIFINNGSVSFGAPASNTTEEEPTEEIILKNFIFKEKLFDSNTHLLELRRIIAHAIDMDEYNVMFGEANHYTINPEFQNEWYYIMKAIEETEITTRLSVPKFIDQMIEWYPWLFNFETADEMVKYKRKMEKSISHEKSLWKYGKTKEVTKLKDMWARFSKLGIDYAKVERMYNVAYSGLYIKLQALKAEIEKERSTR